MNMYSKIRRKKISRVVSLFFAGSLLTQICFPTVAYALTDGPSQPEVESFEPITTNQMVDLFSGDFTYNIPLLTVPGPNGGYPLNMAYHSGIGMEQEASWVGLGWNLNPGVISRNMRGLPDDFKGAVIRKEQYTKPNRTYSIGVGDISPEVFGADLNFVQGGAQIFYNNYKGVGMSFDVSFSKVVALGGVGSVSGGLGYNYDSHSGVGLSPSLGLNLNVGRLSGSLNASRRYQGRDGLQSTSISSNVNHSAVQNMISNASNYSFSGIGAGMTFNEGSTISPHTEFPTKSNSFTYAHKITWSPTPKSYPKIKLTGSFSQTKQIQNDYAYKSYGYLYSEEAGAKHMMDVNRDMLTGITHRTKHLSIPQFTYDTYDAKAQGFGGNFRAYRSEVELLHDPAVQHQNFDGFNTETEFGTMGLGEIHKGIDIQTNFSEMYSGPWRDNDFTNSMQGFSNSVKKENYYMKANGEQTATPATESSFVLDDLPYAFDLDGTDNIIPSTSEKQRSTRERRMQHMSLRTLNELEKAKDYHFPIHTLHGYASYSDMIDNTDDKDAALGEQIGEVSVLNGNGYKYVYGLPAYNLEQKEVSFAIDPSDIKTVDGIEVVDYTEGQDNVVENGNGADEFYSMTRTPRYAHSYFLTAVYSPDYVDLTGDGPTEDDLGYYVVFDYELHEDDYQWRTPYFHANYMEGRHGASVDDKASYTWGRKQIYYLNGLETKTHEAKFTLEERKDGFGATGEHAESPITDASQAASMKALKRIDLFSKSASDYGTSTPEPIKSVHFEYDYSLCKGAYNSIANDSGTAPCADSELCGGKLTLKKLFFTYGNNTKGALSPYKFTYDENPDYRQEAADRWGNYKVPNEFGTSNKRMPYVNQYADYDRDGNVEEEDIDKRNQNAAAWNLSKIDMPSGAELNINYESDDYAYVQNKRAMQAMRIRKVNSAGTSLDANASLKSTDFKIYIEPDEVPDIVDPSTSNLMDEYLADVNDLYFKVYMQLKDGRSDYVEGYAQVNHSGASGFELVDGKWLGYFHVRSVDIADHHSHPFHKAALQHLRMNRTDLLDTPDVEDDGDMSLSDIWEFFENFYEKNLEFFKGYYNHSYDKGYGDTIELSNSEFPSVVRLNSPDHIKYGGGHRVQSVVLSDRWSEMTADESSFEYGQRYHYRLPNGFSSGVAENEPMVGGEESALRRPDRSSAQAKDLILKHADFYSEYPLGRSYMPGASVGYSRVVVESISRDSDPAREKTKDGRTVNEFYTAKDFPVMVNNTVLTGSYVQKYSKTIEYPLIGSYNNDRESYSQGYQIELNDMHGKAKSTATYAASTPLFASEVQTNFELAEPEQEVFYEYDTQGSYSPNKINRLDNKVNVLYHEGFRRHDYLGMTSDFFVDTRESHSRHETEGSQFNIESGSLTSTPSLSWFFRYDDAVQNFKTITAVRVINKTGIQTQTKYLQDGTHYTQTNHLFDSETGSPLLTSTTNEFGNPIYDYNIPAHWYYEGLSGAYKNQGIRMTITDGVDNTIAYGAGETIVLGNVDKGIFSLGDKLEVLDTDGDMELYWVTDLVEDETIDTEEEVTLSNTDGSSSAIDGTSLEIYIVESGRKNGLETMAGYIKYLNLDEGASVLDALSGDLSIKVYNTTGILEEEGVPGTVASGHPFMSETFEGVTLAPHMGFARVDYDYCDQTIAGSGSGLADNPPLYGFFYTENLEEVLANNTFFNTIEPYLEPYSLVILNNSFSSFYEENENFNCYAQISFPDDFIDDFDLEDEVYGDLDNYSFVTSSDGVTATVTDPVFLTSTSYECTWTDFGGCFELCPNVLDANAIEFSDDWVYTYDDYGTQDVENGNTLNSTSINPYRYGKKGLWKPKRTNLYQVDRKQEGGDSGESFKTDISQDGVYDHFRYFDWTPDGNNSDYWTWATEITRYSPYGFEVENKDALGRYSAALYGYDNSLVVAVAKNAAYPEIAFDGFEDHHNINPSITYQNHGHIDMDITESDLSNYVSHSGDYSLAMLSGTKEHLIPYDDDFTGAESYKLLEGKSYLVSCWVYFEGKANGNVEVKQNGVTISGANEHQDIVIEGWTKIEKQFTVGTTGDLKLILTSNHPTDPVYFDDIRIQPVQSSMKTYVYQPGDLKLSAELDDQNMATFYNYDEEGILVQVKKETLQGIQTLKTTRNNTYHEE